MQNPLRRSTAFEQYIAPAHAHAALWRVVASAGLVFGVLIGAGILIGSILLRMGVGEAEALGAGAMLTSRNGTLLLLSSFVLWWAGLALALRLFHRRRLRSLFGPDLSIGLRRFAIGAGLALGFAALSAAIGAALVGPPVRSGLSIGTWLGGAALALPLLLIQTGAEEALFRGYLQQQLAARFRSALIWAVLPSVLFGLLHWNPAAPGSIGAVVAITTLSGLLFAILTARTGGLGLAWGMHFGVNVSVLVFIAPRDYLSGVALMHWVPEPEVFSRLVWLDLLMIIVLVALAALWAARR
ncbi:MAG: CPBP family intramembrane glutamic endopeptidase [Pseudomonadota bacterium]